MCTCASCSYTDGYAGKGFAEWPRGEPAGPRSSAAAYAAHVRHSFMGARVRSEVGKPAGAAWYGSPSVSRAEVEAVLRRTFGLEPAEAPRPAEAGAVSPATPCKAPQHFPAGDRTSEAATIYDMRKEKAKRSVGRPPLPGRRVIVKLEERQIKAAEKLGAGNIAAGIRKALQSA
jgi:hypothetical protein